MQMEGTAAINKTSSEENTPTGRTLNPYAIPSSLSPVWIACHYARKLAKKQVVQANISTVVEQIALFTKRPDTSLRVTGGLLVGVAKLYARKVEYFHLECCGVLQRLQNSESPYFGKLCGNGATNGTLNRALPPPPTLSTTSGNIRSSKTSSRPEETHSSPSHRENALNLPSEVSTTLMQAELAQEDRDFDFLEETLAKELSEDTSNGAAALCALSREVVFNTGISLNDIASEEPPGAADSELPLTTHVPVEPALKDVQYFSTDRSTGNIVDGTQCNSQTPRQRTGGGHPTHAEVVTKPSFTMANASPQVSQLYESVHGIPAVDDGFTPLSLSDVGVYVRPSEHPLEKSTMRPAAFGVNDVPGPIERLRGVEGPVLVPHTMALTPGRQTEYGTIDAFYQRQAELSTPFLRPMTARRARGSDVGFDNSSGRQRDSLDTMDPSPALAVYSPIQGDGVDDDSITRNLALRTPGLPMRRSVASDATDHPFLLPLSPNGTPCGSGLQPLNDTDYFPPDAFAQTWIKQSTPPSTSSEQLISQKTSGKQPTSVERLTAAAEPHLVTRETAKLSIVRRRMRSAPRSRSCIFDDETVLSDSILHSWRESLTDILRQPETENVKKHTPVFLSERLEKAAELSSRPRRVLSHTQNAFTINDETLPLLSCDGASRPIDQQSTPLSIDRSLRLEDTEEEPEEEAIVVCGVPCDTDYDPPHLEESIGVTTPVSSIERVSPTEVVFPTGCMTPLSCTLEEPTCSQTKKSATDEADPKESFCFPGTAVSGSLSPSVLPGMDQPTNLSEAAELQHALYGEQYPLFIWDPLSTLETNSAPTMMRTPFKTPFIKEIQRCDTETTVTPLRSPLSPMSETSWGMRVTPHTPLKPSTPVAYAENKSPVEVHHAVAHFRPTECQDDGNGTTAVMKKKDMFSSGGAFDTLVGEVGFSKRTIRILQYVYNKLHHRNFHARRIYTTPRNVSLSQNIAYASLSPHDAEYHPKHPAPPSLDRETSSVPVLSFTQLMTGQPRNSVAATFFELMALKTRNYVELIVDKGSLDRKYNGDDILIAATNRLEGLALSHPQGDAA